MQRKESGEVENTPSQVRIFPYTKFIQYTFAETMAVFVYYTAIYIYVTNFCMMKNIRQRDNISYIDNRDSFN